MWICETTLYNSMGKENTKHLYEWYMLNHENKLVSKILDYSSLSINQIAQKLMGQDHWHPQSGASILLIRVHIPNRNGDKVQGLRSMDEGISHVTADVRCKMFQGNGKGNKRRGGQKRRSNITCSTNSKLEVMQMPSHNWQVQRWHEISLTVRRVASIGPYFGYLLCHLGDMSIGFLGRIHQWYVQIIYILYYYKIYIWYKSYV